MQDQIEYMSGLLQAHVKKRMRRDQVLWHSIHTYCLQYIAIFIIVAVVCCFLMFLLLLLYSVCDGCMLALMPNRFFLLLNYCISPSRCACGVVVFKIHGFSLSICQ